ncbi:GNAT family N-acetyltransferase, partial [Accumulibacter sp.]
MSVDLSAPQPLSTAHRIDDFCCGEHVLDDWLKRREMATQLGGASRGFVFADRQGRVYGHQVTAAGAVSHQLAPERVRPDPIPVMVLARIAVDRRSQEISLGAALLRDAVNRTVTVSQSTDVRALLVHALHEHTRWFDEYYGLT